ncbi:hypothetical protein DMN91_001938 [Ooceraea biroi]|uniref:CCHC-type domain-containing protein n=1 Tax=Ooceraea biroi TaxID=2015173 RepID=A0A3L8E0R5_OOCBI|nr:hypothetical protein DMN91_001938 [Ooceraea biroi]
MREAMFVSGEDVIREWTSIESAATQTDRDVTHATVQTERRTHNTVTQTTNCTKDVATQTGSRTASPVQEPRRRTPSPASRLPRIAMGCWNCGGTHRYVNCPLPREQFCYGCGMRGVTLRECQRCGSHYRQTDPRQGPRGPRDRARSTEGVRRYRERSRSRADNR